MDLAGFLRKAAQLGFPAVELMGKRPHLSVLDYGASELAASVEETSASLEEMSSMIQENYDNCLRAKALASETRLVAEGGSRMMIEMVEAMAEIDSSSAQVAKIVKEIDEIAFQTNILAQCSGGSGAGR